MRIGTMLRGYSGPRLKQKLLPLRDVSIHPSMVQGSLVLVQDRSKFHPIVGEINNGLASSLLGLV